MKITTDEQFELRNKAKSELERLETVMSDVAVMQLLDCYKNKCNCSEPR